MGCGSLPSKFISRVSIPLPRQYAQVRDYNTGTARSLFLALALPLFGQKIKAVSVSGRDPRWLHKL
jgi:hypothetical protein